MTGRGFSILILATVGGTLSSCLDSALFSSSFTPSFFASAVAERPTSRTRYETEGLEVTVSASATELTPADRLVVTVECVVNAGVSDSDFPVPRIVTSGLDAVGPVWEILGSRREPTACEGNSCVFAWEFLLATGLPGEYVIPPFGVVVPGLGALETAGIPVSVSSVVPSTEFDRDGSDRDDPVHLRPILEPEFPRRVPLSPALIGTLLVVIAGLVVYLLTKRRGREPMPISDSERYRREVEAVVRALASGSTDPRRSAVQRESVRKVLRIMDALGAADDATAEAVARLEEMIYSGRPFDPSEAAEQCRHLTFLIRTSDGAEDQPAEKEAGR